MGEKRISVDDALEHPYFSEIRTVEEELVCPSVFDYSFEKLSDGSVPTEEIVLSKSKLQTLIWEVVEDLQRQKTTPDTQPNASTGETIARSQLEDPDNCEEQKQEADVDSNSPQKRSSNGMMNSATFAGKQLKTASHDNGPASADDTIDGKDDSGHSPRNGASGVLGNEDQACNPIETGSNYNIKTDADDQGEVSHT